MDLQKLNPWNWFKHEEDMLTADNKIPVRREMQGSNAGWFYQHPLHPMSQIHQEMDRLINDAFRGLGFPSVGSSLFDAHFPGSLAGMHEQGFRPELNVSSDESSYEITLEVPGLNESDMSVEVRGDVLTIRGEKLEEAEDKGRQFYRVERRHGTFQRTLDLPDDANVEEIQASMKDGVLRLTVPRSLALNSEVKKITIH